MDHHFFYRIYVCSSRNGNRENYIETGFNTLIVYKQIDKRKK